MSSHSSQSGGLPLSLSAQASVMSPASLAQLVDRLSQDHGLNGAARQQLHLFAVQASPSVDALWIYTLSLSNAVQFEQVMSQFGMLTQRLESLTNLVRHEWQLTKAQKVSIQELQRVFIVRSTTSYRDLADRVKAYISENPLQFSLPMYNTDNAVATVVNTMVEKDSHQVRGLYRKYIYAAAVGPRRLDLVARKIASVFSTEIGEGPLPVYYKAQVAQLRSIAFDLIQAAGSPPANSKRTKADTGFWSAVDSTFEALVRAHGRDYDNGVGWRQWEADVIGQDEAKFDGHTDNFSPAIIQLHAPAVYSHVALAAE